MHSSDLVWIGPPEAPPDPALGARRQRGMNSPFMTAFAEGLAARGNRIGGLRVARFEFPYMKAQREGKQRPPDREAVLPHTHPDLSGQP